MIMFFEESFWVKNTEDRSYVFLVQKICYLFKYGLANLGKNRQNEMAFNNLTAS